MNAFTMRKKTIVIVQFLLDQVVEAVPLHFRRPIAMEFLQQMGLWMFRPSRDTQREFSCFAGVEQEQRKMGSEESISKRSREH